jgi:hypothetical protein
MADVIMGNALDVTQTHRQHRLGAVQGLNPALLIPTKYQSVIGRVQVKADDIAHLLNEKGVVESLKLRPRCGCTAKV